MSLVRQLVPLLTAVALGGCASSMSGVGGTDKYACKAPEGALCTSVSGVYANSLAGPVTTSKEAQPVPAAGKRSYGAASDSAAATIPAGSSIRSNPRVLRVWIAPLGGCRMAI
jgi:conjugal transfer pilus assembly protein TraV